VTLLVLQALQDVTDVRLDITVVAGASNPHCESLRKAVAKSSHLARLLTDVDNMPEVMADADLAISAGGGTCYELAFMRVPMFLITITANHERTVEVWGEAGAAVAAGWFDAFVGKSMSVELRQLIGDGNLRREPVENASRMVDGRGAQRVVETMYTMYQEGTAAT
jgi:spore coat polysaccharide biosynthesis predicted glycosyltransferase SpsG